jgi:hypothetical protein
MKDESAEEALARLIDKTNPSKGYAYMGWPAARIANSFHLWESFNEKFLIAFAAMGAVTAFLDVRDATGNATMAKWASLAIFFFPRICLPVLAVAQFFVDGINWFSCGYIILSVAGIIWLRQLRMRAIEYFDHHPQ